MEIENQWFLTRPSLGSIALAPGGMSIYSCTSQGGPIIMAPILKRYIKPLAIAAVALAIFVIVDLPQIVRTKALIVNMLPLDAQTKLHVVDSLCKAAYAEFEGSWKCYFANVDTAAQVEVQQRREELERCDKVKERVNLFDWAYDPKDKSYAYIGSDPTLKGKFYWPERCELRDTKIEEFMQEIWKLGTRR